MPAPTLLYVTAGAWGAGEGAPHTAAEVDTNFYNIFLSIQDLIDNPPTPVSIDHFEITSNNHLVVVFTDASEQDVGQLPIAEFHDRGAWTHPEDYVYGDIFTNGTGLYMVLQDHSTESPFNPDRVILGNPVYRLLFDASGMTMTYLDDGYPAEGETVNAFDVFSVPDVGVFMALSEHEALAAFDPDALDEDDNPLYKQIFEPIETATARIQFQYPGSFPSDESMVWKLIQDDPRNLVFEAGFVGSIGHLEVAVSTEDITFTIEYDGDEIGTLTFEIGTLLDGDGGQFGTFDGVGHAGITNQGLIRMYAPGVSDATARFLTVALVGEYVEP